jgi:hypothetical protein
MRRVSLVFSIVVTVSLGGAALAYLENRIGQHRIPVQDEWLSAPEQQAFKAYGDSEKPDTTWIALQDSIR